MLETDIGLSCADSGCQLLITHIFITRVVTGLLHRFLPSTPLELYCLYSYSAILMRAGVYKASSTLPYTGFVYAIYSLSFCVLELPPL